MLARVFPDDVSSESLLNIPLVRRAFSDPYVRPVARRADLRWYHTGVLASSLSAFNPFGDQIFYPARSPLRDWLDNAAASARPLNHADRLVRQVLYSVHDYLHVWSYGVMRELLPERNFGFGQLSRENFEEQLFAFLLSEAAAVVGLDYWYLSTIDLSEVCPIGSEVQRIAVHYRESSLPEYRRARPHLTVQTPDFFTEIAAFYCTGELFGFASSDLAASPALLTWLGHEMDAGESQRELGRVWLSYLAGWENDRKINSDPVACDAEWQIELMNELGSALWRFVKAGEDAPRRAPPPNSQWRSPGPFEPRFRNASLLDDKELEAFISSCDAEKHAFFLTQQLVSHLDYDGFERGKLPALKQCVAESDIVRLRELCAGEPRLAASEHEPRDILFG